MITHDLTAKEVGQAFAVKRRHAALSASDGFRLVTARDYPGILLTGDALLRRVAAANGLRYTACCGWSTRLRPGRFAADRCSVGRSRHGSRMMQCSCPLTKSGRGLTIWRKPGRGRPATVHGRAIGHSIEADVLPMSSVGAGAPIGVDPSASALTVSMQHASFRHAGAELGRCVATVDHSEDRGYHLHFVAELPLPGVTGRRTLRSALALVQRRCNRNVARSHMVPRDIRTPDCLASPHCIASSAGLSTV